MWKKVRKLDGREEAGTVDCQLHVSHTTWKAGEALNSRQTPSRIRSIALRVIAIKRRFNMSVISSTHVARLAAACFAGTLITPTDKSSKGEIRGRRRTHVRSREHFRFSVLQILQHDMDEGDVQSVEKSWKDRLGTREFGLNDN
jgi:hypothetical protein